MKTVVFAYHDMGITGLDALLRAGFDVAAVFSHEDDPEENCWFGSVSKWADLRGVPLFCPEDVNSPQWIGRISAMAPDVVFSFYYRNMLSRAVWEMPRSGAFNLHGSLLPRYRGRCPVNWVLVNGEEETGVTLHRMVDKADAGDILAQRAVPIAFDDTAKSLYKKLCREAALLLDDILPSIKAGTAVGAPQDLSAGSYFGGRTPADGRIDWQWTALRIYNLIRAVTDPYPGAFAFTGRGEKMIIWWGLPDAEGLSREPGLVELEGEDAFVHCGGGGRIKLMDVEIGAMRLKGAGIGRCFKDRKGERLQ